MTQDGEALKADLLANAPSPIRYANPNMPKDVLREDTVIQEYPLAVKGTRSRSRPPRISSGKPGLPGKQDGRSVKAASPR